MQRSIIPVFILALTTGAAWAQPLSIAPPAYQSADEEEMSAEPPAIVMAQVTTPPRANLGGGFIEFLFGDRGQQQAMAPQAVQPRMPPQADRPIHASAAPAGNPMPEERAERQMDPRFLRQEVDYPGKAALGTIVIDTPNHFLYLVEGDGKAMRYGIGVGRPGFTWSGEHAISAKKEWPDWVPPKEMIERQPGLPHFMAGGPNNPLGARAMYLGSTLYRIHGSNEPWTIGQNVSSGCIRMRNVDVIDLYGRVNVGTKVVVL